MASRDDEKAMDGMIRRTLAHNVPESVDCPPPEILAAYYERSLDTDEAARCELHFSRCARCREQLAAISRAEAEPRLHAAPRWLLTGRWLVPAIAMILIAFVWVARRPTKRGSAGQSSNAPLVAMSKPAPNPAIEGTSGGEMPSSLPSSTGGPAKAVPSEDLTISTKELPSDSIRSRSSVKMQPRAKKDVEAPAGVVGDATGGVASGGAVADKYFAKESVAPQPPRVLPRIATEQTEVTADSASAQMVPENKEAVTHLQTQAPPPSAAAPVQRVDSHVSEIMPTKKVATATAAKGKASNVWGSANLVMLDQASLMSVIKTPEPTVVWRIIAEESVERSEDGGATWEVQSPYPNAHFLAGAAPSAKICWLVGRDGMIVLTSDGKHWRKIEPPIPVDLVGVTAQDASVAVVTAVHGRKFTTSNGGKAWSPVQ